MFIAKNNDLIILAKDTREELEQALDLCFELCDEADPAMTTANILDCLKRLDPTLEVSPETMGRVLRDSAIKCNTDPRWQNTWGRDLCNSAI